MRESRFPFHESSSHMSLLYTQADIEEVCHRLGSSRHSFCHRNSLFYFMIEGDNEHLSLEYHLNERVFKRLELPDCFVDPKSVFILKYVYFSWLFSLYFFSSFRLLFNDLILLLYD